MDRSVAFGHVVQISCQHFGSLNVVPNIDFFILRVGTIVSRSHWQQHHALTSYFLQMLSILLLFFIEKNDFGGS